MMAWSVESLVLFSITSEMPHTLLPSLLYQLANPTQITG